MQLSDLARVDLAFATLKSKGYEVNTTGDCNTCSTSEFHTNKYVYYVTQDTEHLIDGMFPFGGAFYIGWGEDGDINEICEQLQLQGFFVHVPPSEATKIIIK